MLVQIHSPEAFKLGLKSRWCEEFVSYWSAKPCTSLAATIHCSSPLLRHTLASHESEVRAVNGGSETGSHWAVRFWEARKVVWLFSDKVFKEENVTESKQSDSL